MTFYRSSTARCATLLAPLTLSLLAGSAFAAAGDAPTAAAAMPTTATPATTGNAALWREQTMKFTYDGITTLYTCDGLEGKVRDILLAFGARKDLKVRATGCDRGSNLPSRFAWVEANYSYLAPGSEAEVAGAGAVKTNWSPVEIAPNRPSFMGAGECELVEQMRDALAKGFTLRNVQYRTSCTPHQVSLGAYAVKAEVLKPDAHAQ